MCCWKKEKDTSGVTVKYSSVTVRMSIIKRDIKIFSNCDDPSPSPGLEPPTTRSLFMGTALGPFLVGKEMKAWQKNYLQMCQDSIYVHFKWLIDETRFPVISFPSPAKRS